MADLENPRQGPGHPERIGPYTILSRLGKGAMGVVYCARDDRMNREVAVKVMMVDLESEPDARARFFREAQVTGRLLHRHIVTVFDIGEEHGRPFIVMELLRGKTLAERLKDPDPDFDALETKLDLMIQTCEGLAVAHAAGVVHRDVKPSNLFVLTDGHLKILDFGVARLADSNMTSSGLIMGTPDYMSPEQAEGRVVDARSDIFSAAAVFYEMVTRQKPFGSGGLAAVLGRVKNENPPPIKDQEAPAAVTRIIMQALEKNPARRYQSCTDLAAALVRVKRSFNADTRTVMTSVKDCYKEIHRVAAEIQQARATRGLPASNTVTGQMADIDSRYPALRAVSGGATGSLLPFQRRQLDAILHDLQAVLLPFQGELAKLRGMPSIVETGPRPRAKPEARAVTTETGRLREARLDEPLDDESFLTVQTIASARSRAKAGGLDDAISTLDAFARAHPNSPDVARELDRMRAEAARATAEAAAARAVTDREAAEAADRARRQATLEAEALVAAEAIATARAAFNAGRTDEAIRTLEAVVREHPTAPGAAVELQRLKLEAAHLAAEAARRAEAEARAAAAEARAMRLQQLTEAIDTAIDGGQLDRAEALAQEARALDPDGGLLATTEHRLRDAHRQATIQTEARAAAHAIASARNTFNAGRVDEAIGALGTFAREHPNAPGVAAELRRLQTEAARLAAEAERRAAAEREAAAAAARSERVQQLVADAEAAIAGLEFDIADTRLREARALDPDGGLLVLTERRLDEARRRAARDNEARLASQAIATARSTFHSGSTEKAIAALDAFLREHPGAPGVAAEAKRLRVEAARLAAEAAKREDAERRRKEAEARTADTAVPLTAAATASSATTPKPISTPAPAAYRVEAPPGLIASVARLPKPVLVGCLGGLLVVIVGVMLMMKSGKTARPVTNPPPAPPVQQQPSAEDLRQQPITQAKQLKLAVTTPTPPVAAAAAGNAKSPKAPAPQVAAPIPEPQPLVPRRPNESDSDWAARDRDIADRYEKATTLLSAGSFDSAKALLSAIDAEEPNYKDVGALILKATAGVHTAGRDALEAATKLEEKSDWPGARDAYQRARQVDASTAGIADAGLKRILDHMKNEGADALKKAKAFEFSGNKSEAMKQYEIAYKYLPDGDPDQQFAKAHYDALKIKK